MVERQTQRLNVLVLTDTLAFGGAERHTIALLNHLDVQRTKISFVYLKPIEHLISTVDTKRLDHVLCLNIRGKVDWRAVRRLAALLREWRVDAILCTNPYAMMYAVLAKAASRTQVSIVEVFHTTILRSFKDKLQLLYYRIFFRCCDALVYVCRAQQTYWRQRHLHARRDIAIHNGIDVDFFTDRYTTAEKTAVRAELGLGADDYVVGICAALRPEKAHGDLLKAIALLKSRGVQVHCMIIGDGAERAAVEARIDRLGLRDQVRITGLKPDVRPYVASCDAMALVSKSVETFSLAVLEAMALSKPVIASRIGGTEEQIEDEITGLLFSAGDINALAAALEKLANPEVRRSMGRRANEKVRREFSLEDMIEAYHALFLSLQAAQFKGFPQ